MPSIWVVVNLKTIVKLKQFTMKETLWSWFSQINTFYLTIGPHWKQLVTIASIYYSSKVPKDH